MSISISSLNRIGNGKLEDYKDHTDPKYFGPGIWYVIHSQSTICDNIDKEHAYIDMIYRIRDKLPCEICRGHFSEYLDSNPPSDYLSTNIKSSKIPGIAVWGWKFHNEVNKRLGKPIMKWSTFEQIYQINLDDMICIPTSPCKNSM